jgi:hypothetical protein
LELWLGPPANGSAFSNNEERREQWFRHRDRLLAIWGQHGRRPLAWWAYEAPIPYPGYDREGAVLYEAGLLTETEVTELVAEWRRQFERAQDPEFWLCDEPETFLESAAARKAHYRWCGIPSKLIKEWTVARRRRNKAAGKPQAAATPLRAAAARSMAGTEEWPAARPNKRMDVQRFPRSSARSWKKSLVHLIRGANRPPMREWEAEMRNARFEVVLQARQRWR